MSPAQLYESPFYIAFGPLGSALLAGFAALDWWGRPYLTQLGQDYLNSVRDA